MPSHVPCPLLPVLGGRSPQSWFGSLIDLLLELSQGFPPLWTQGTLLVQDLGYFWDRVKTWTLQVENRTDLPALTGAGSENEWSQLEPREQV